jgi:hypothetical protein
MLIYSMSVSVDGFITDREGVLGGGTPFLPSVTEDVPLDLIETQDVRLTSDLRALAPDRIRTCDLRFLDRRDRNDGGRRLTMRGAFLHSPCGFAGWENTWTSGVWIERTGGVVAL